MDTMRTKKSNIKSEEIMKKTLTVVVPTYNIEKYIEQCLASFVIEEVMDQLEVLVINDGSQDGSVAIAEKFEVQYPQTFRIIHKKNGGHGSTINRGIQEAKGQYFKVVDGDDWVERAAFVKLVTNLNQLSSDAIISNYYWVHDANGSRKPEFKEPFPGVVYGREYRFTEVSDNLFMKMHALTIRTELLRKIPQIDEHCFYVDMEYVLFPIPFIQTVTCLDEFVYMYRIGLATQSMNMKSMQRNEEHYDRVLKRLLAYYTEQADRNIAQPYLNYLEHSLGRMVATRFKIFLSFPYDKKIEIQMRKFDKNLRGQYPLVYTAVKNKAVLMLQKSNFKTYILAHKLFQMKERLKR